MLSLQKKKLGFYLKSIDSKVSPIGWGTPLILRDHLDNSKASSAFNKIRYFNILG